MHVLVHEVQDGEPESSEGWQGEQRREVLQEDLRGHTQGAGFMSATQLQGFSHLLDGVQAVKNKSTVSVVGLIY